MLHVTYCSESVQYIKKKSYEGLNSEEAKKQPNKHRIVCVAHTEIVHSHWSTWKLFHVSIGCHSMTMTNAGFNLFNFQQAFLHIIAATGIWSQHYTWNWFEVWKFWHWAKWGQFSNLFFLLVRTTRVNDVKALEYFTYPPPKKDDLMEKWDGKSNGLKKNVIFTNNKEMPVTIKQRLVHFRTLYLNQVGNTH